jgi:hypothetical protein
LVCRVGTKKEGSVVDGREGVVPKLKRGVVTGVVEGTTGKKGVLLDGAKFAKVVLGKPMIGVVAEEVEVVVGVVADVVEVVVGVVADVVKVVVGVVADVVEVVVAKTKEGVVATVEGTAGKNGIVVDEAKFVVGKTKGPVVVNVVGSTGAEEEVVVVVLKELTLNPFSFTALKTKSAVLKLL